MKICKDIALLLLLASPFLTHAIDTDGDGSEDSEEISAGTNPNDAGERPYWWRTYHGDEAFDAFGDKVRTAGDVNADGYDDLLIGSKYDSNNAIYNGSVRILSGLNGNTLYNIEGSIEYAYVGANIDGGVDLNKDGYDDFMYGFNQVGFERSARVHSGIDGSVMFEFLDLGYLIRNAGDVNGDSYPDIILSYENDINGGSVGLLSGLDGSELHLLQGETAEVQLGALICGVGDVNADGYDDVAVTASNPVEIRIYSGESAAVIYSIDISDGFSRAMECGSDINQDGYQDIITTNRAIDYQGQEVWAVRVFSGEDGSIIHTIYGGIDRSYPPVASGLGDIDLDGYPDILVGVKNDTWAGYESGSSYLYSGQTGELLYSFHGDANERNFGNSVSNAGDVDGDGVQDFVIAAYSDDVNGENSGSVRVFLTVDLLNDIDLDFLVNSVDADDDNDGMPDTWENANSLNPLFNDAGEDPDGDGFTNLEEYINGTDPHVFDGTPISAADTDYDGDSDILWQNTTTGRVWVWHQQDFAKVGETDVGVFQPSYVLADTADLDGDGDSDLILFDGDPAVGQAIRWEMENHAKVAGAVLAGFPGWQFKGTGDFDGDGDGDIIWQNEDGSGALDGTVIVWIMENLTKQSGSSLGRHEFGARVEAIGDFDNDGDADILQSIPSGPALIRWDFENGGKVAGASIGGFVGYSVKAVGDFNGDATDDILWEPEGAGQAIIWSMLNGDKDMGAGVGSLTNYDIETVGDYDADGDADVLWKNANGHVIIWEMENAAKVSGSAIDTFDAEHDVKP